MCDCEGRELPGGGRRCSGDAGDGILGATVNEEMRQQAAAQCDSEGDEAKG